MEIKNIMTTGVECVNPQNTLKEAAAKMKEFGIGVLPVCDEDQIFGIITDRDIVIRAIAQGVDPNKIMVKDAMTPNVECCFDDDDLKQIVQKMKEMQIRRMVVIDHNKKLIGMITLGDISVHGDHQLAEEALERISEPARPIKRI
jgi:CBS domain-containing protein